MASASHSWAMRAGQLGEGPSSRSLREPSHGLPTLRRRRCRRAMGPIVTVTLTHRIDLCIIKHYVWQFGMSEDQLACIRHVFNTFDVDAGGYLSVVELSTLTTELGEDMDGDEIRSAMDRLDVNGDGKVKFDEFVAWWAEDDS